MAQNTTLVSLPQLVDLSLNCPEMGSINYNILHVLLHVLLQQVEQTDVAVEFRGDDSDRIQSMITAMRPHSTLYLSQYEIQGGKTKRKSRKISLQDIKQMSKEEKLAEQEINVIEPRKQSTEDPSPSPAPMKSPPPSSKNIIAKTSQTVVVVDSPSKLPQFSIAITKSHFDMLVNDVNVVKEKMKELVELPSNMGLIEATRSPSKPVLDMFQILHLTKRMEASEEGLNKVLSLIEDLAREQGKLDSGFQSKLAEAMVAKTVEPPPTAAKMTPTASAAQSSQVGSGSGGTAPRASVAASVAVEAAAPSGAAMSRRVLSKMAQFDRRLAKLERMSKTLAEGGDLSAVAALEGDEGEESGGEKEGSDANEPLINIQFLEGLEAMQIEIDKIKEWIHNLSSKGSYVGNAVELAAEEEAMLAAEMAAAAAAGVEPGEMPSSIMLKNAIRSSHMTEGMDKRMAEVFNKVTALDQVYNGQINTLQEQMGSMQKEVGDLLLKINTILPGGDNDELNIDNQRKLYEKLKLLEKEVTFVNDAAIRLQEDKEERDRIIKEMLEQIDLLKLVKANREDLEDALDDKADACLINRKVSHDQFDAACDDLTKGIEQALDKLTQQEELWKQALYSIQRDIGNKLDKAEVDPLRDFVNNKLRTLQEKFKSLTALRREQEAAGTKSKFLRNVNCISCDKDVVMRKEMDPSLKPQAFPMPPNRNIAPYLAYELDQLRKQQKCVPNSKNLNFFENAMKQKMAKDKTHICNRYCGGSHTVTTPQQRVTRLGHFLEQWGPEISPLNDDFVKGTNNHLYKARDDEGLKKMVSKDRNKSAPTKEEYVAKTQENIDTATVINAEAQQALLEPQKPQVEERRSSKMSKSASQVVENPDM